MAGAGDRTGDGTRARDLLADGERTAPEAELASGLAHLHAQQARMTEVLGQLAQGQLALAGAVDRMLEAVEAVLAQRVRARRRPPRARPPVLH
jgi:hypothetical protein